MISRYHQIQQFRYRDHADFEKWLKTYSKFKIAKLVTAKSWKDCAFGNVVDFCQNTKYKSLLARIFEKARFNSDTSKISSQENEKTPLVPDEKTAASKKDPR